MENILPNANKKASLTKSVLAIFIYTYNTFPDLFTYDACDLSDFTFFSHMDIKLFFHLVSFLGCSLLLNSHFVCLYHRSCFIVNILRISLKRITAVCELIWSTNVSQESRRWPL